MPQTERSPYEHSLFELCGRIHGHCAGSGDAFDAAVKRLCYEEER